MSEDEKIGQCDTCEKKNVKVLFSYTLDKWQCERCDDYSADLIWYGDDD
jgi:ribosomal protein L37AE/L43A